VAAADIGAEDVWAEEVGAVVTVSALPFTAARSAAVFFAGGFGAAGFADPGGAAWVLRSETADVADAFMPNLMNCRNNANWRSNHRSAAFGIPIPAYVAR
jgi:hypothetical protein